MIVTDVIESHTLRLTDAGYGIDRIYIVTDIGGTAEARLYNATLTSGVPQFGDPHPAVPDVQVTDVQASPIDGDPDAIQIRITYSVPDTDDAANEDEQIAGALTISSDVVTESTHFDINGELIKASYSTALSVLTTNYSAIDVQRPQMRVSLSRTEAIAPKDAILNYLGRINSIDWSGFPAETWLCTGIDVSEDGEEFNVTYNFEYRERTWKGELVLPINTTDAAVNPIDSDSGNGYALFDVYSQANFNDLGLTF